MKSLKVKSLLLLIIFSIFTSCEDKDNMQKINDVKLKNQEQATTLSAAKLHNYLLYYMLNTYPVYQYDGSKFDMANDVINYFYGKELYGFEIGENDLEFVNSPTFVSIFNDFTYDNLIHTYNKGLDSLYKKGEISIMFKDLMFDITKNAKDSSYADTYFKRTMEQLINYESTNKKEEYLLQSFAYVYIYSNAYWTIYFGNDVSYVYGRVLCGIADGVGGGAVGLLLGNVVAGKIAAGFASFCMREDIDAGKICCCLAGHNPCDKECMKCIKPKNQQSNIPPLSEGDDFPLSGESLDAFNAFSAKHEPINL
ncbi:MAG: hypothetical protein RBS13_07860 [Bacteroidales bacterium]|nr:hypothetical protein [Bacteroidales bacterium]